MKKAKCLRILRFNFWKSDSLRVNGLNGHILKNLPEEIQELFLRFTKTVLNDSSFNKYAQLLSELKELRILSLRTDASSCTAKHVEIL